MSEITNVPSENIEIITPVGKHKVELKSWITGRESIKLNQAVMKHVNVDKESLKQIGEGMKMDIKDVDLPGLTTELAEVNITVHVVSVDGKKDNILDAVLDMIEEDYNFVLAEIENIKKKS